MESSIWSEWEKDNNFNSNSTLLDIPTYTAAEVSQLKTSIDFGLPFIIHNVVENDVMSLDMLSSPPLSDLFIDYFSDARKVLLVPDKHDQLGVIMKKIRAGGPEKIGTQRIVQTFPHIVQRCITDSFDLLSTVFGAGRVRTWLELGVSVTVPVFVSTGVALEDGGATTTTRTDLHCEPISNVVFQTAG